MIRFNLKLEGRDLIFFKFLIFYWLSLTIGLIELTNGLIYGLQDLLLSGLFFTLLAIGIHIYIYFKFKDYRGWLYG